MTLCHNSCAFWRIIFSAFEKLLRSLISIFLSICNQGPMLWFFKYLRQKFQRKNWRFWLET
jgi:hypothetical protein